MGQQSALSIDTVSSTLDAVTRASRLLVPLVAAAGITGVGTCVFFELVSLFPCYASSSFSNRRSSECRSTSSVVLRRYVTAFDIGSQMSSALRIGS
ncbi:hypothetical protein [Natrialba swarupiae]|uniref:Uncharacterized protein n=1 Tax=Natrialba swarupiae TaxID=2448032 RepID=A0A5D5ANT9_9EURY|nr:hypothetical protein [Natrialba swarupiae]TYT62673.1 hypothetical protein FYC77_06470 [Natrialba swarupiae]